MFSSVSQYPQTDSTWRFGTVSNFPQNYSCPSGGWLRQEMEVTSSFTGPVWNPKLVEPPKEERSLIVSATPHLSLVESDFDRYADALRQMGQEILEFQPDVILVPFRGALRLWVHLSIYCAMEGRGQPVAFTGKEQKRAETEECIAAMLMPCCGNAAKILVIDTAIGGHGSLEMARLLQHVHDATALWDVHFCLLFPRYVTPYSLAVQNLRKQMRLLSSPAFRVGTGFYWVPNLLGEDMEEAVPGQGVEVDFVRAGTMEKTIVHTSDLARSIDHAIAQSIHFDHLTSDFIQTPVEPAT